MGEIEKIKTYFKKCYRIALNSEKQELIVWEDLKKLHDSNNWRSGFFEKDKMIESRFEIAEELYQKYFHNISNEGLKSSVCIFSNFDNEFASDCFILASHFNNCLFDGKVVIHVNKNWVEYEMMTALITPLLNPIELEKQISIHYHISLDVYQSFQRLLFEQEAPAIIIADLIASKNKDKS